MSSAERGRFMPQDVFDLCVAIAAIGKASNKGAEIVDDLLTKYCAGYPGEDASLPLEVDTLAEDALERARTVLASFGAVEAAQAHKDLLKLTVWVMNEIKRKAEQSKARAPLWKRLFGGTRFNYAPRRLPDRRKSCLDTFDAVLKAFGEQVQIEEFRRSAPTI